MKGIQDFAAGNSQWCIISPRYKVKSIRIENNLVIFNATNN